MGNPQMNDTAAEDVMRELHDAGDATNRVEMTPIGVLPVWLSLAELSGLTGRSQQAIKRASKQQQMPPLYDLLGKPAMRASDYAQWAISIQKWSGK